MRYSLQASTMSMLSVGTHCYAYYLSVRLSVDSGFRYLPQCLHQIAEIYHLKDEDAKAVQFLKAEKIYYEAALIDTKTLHNKIGQLR